MSDMALVPSRDIYSNLVMWGAGEFPSQYAIQPGKMVSAEGVANMMVISSRMNEPFEKQEENTEK